MSEKLNVGIVGTGIFARKKHLPTFVKFSDKFNAAACFNRTKSKAEAFAEVAGIDSSKVYENLEDLLDDDSIDMVDVMVPVQFNYNIAEKCVKAGKPVILEKPIEATLEQASKLVRLSESADIPVAIAENWLNLECIKTTKEEIAKIGPVIGFTYNSTGPFFPSSEYLATSWRQHPEHIGGFLSDGGVHQLSLLTNLLGDIGTVSAFTKQVRQESGADDVVFSTIKLKDSDVIGTFTYGSAFGATEKSVFVKIYGLNGSVTLNVFGGTNKTSVKTMLGNKGEDKPQVNNIDIQEQPLFGVEKEFLNFHEAVIKKDKSLLVCTPRTAFHHLAIVAAFLESSKNGGNTVQVVEP